MKGQPFYTRNKDGEIDHKFVKVDRETATPVHPLSNPALDTYRVPTPFRVLVELQ
jgi:hypothetical protein